MSESFDPKKVPMDAPLHSTKELKLASGKLIQVKSLALGGLFRVLAAFKKSGIKRLPTGLGILDVLEVEQRKQLQVIDDIGERAKLLTEFYENLSEDKRALLRASGEMKTEAIFEWVCGCEGMIEALVFGMTGMSAKEISELGIADGLNILSEGISLLDIPATVEAVMGFIGRIGGLMDAAGRQSDRVTGESNQEAAPQGQAA